MKATSANNRNTETEPDEFQYATSAENNLRLMRVLNEITFLDRMRPIMIGVAKILLEAGADFSKCREPGT